MPGQCKRFPILLSQSRKLIDLSERLRGESRIICPYVCILGMFFIRFRYFTVYRDQILSGHQHNVFGFRLSIRLAFVFVPISDNIFGMDDTRTRRCSIVDLLKKKKKIEEPIHTQNRIAIL